MSHTEKSCMVSYHRQFVDKTGFNNKLLIKLPNSGNKKVSEEKTNSHDRPEKLTYRKASLDKINIFQFNKL